MIKYLGSKRLLLERIVAAVAGAASSPVVLDLFSGTARVGHALKRRGLRVISNDHNAYAEVLARGLVAADREEVEVPARRLLEDLSRLPPRPGYFTETFCERSRFVHPRNGARIDAIREEIARLALPADLEAVLLVALMLAADRVDSTTGVQMAYLKEWAPRAHHDLELRMPPVLPRIAAGRCAALGLDAVEAARIASADVAYVDPPYNQHSYLGNYHVWESLVRWDKPETFGVACKRIDCRERGSDFNSRRRCREAMRTLLDAIDARVIVASFNDEGHLPREAMESLLRERIGARGRLEVLAIDHPRYVGARIGIHNPRGEKVGTVGRLRNVEYLFVATQGPRSLPRKVRSTRASETSPDRSSPRHVLREAVEEPSPAAT